MDDLIAFYRARLDELDADDYHDRTECNLGNLQFFGDCCCDVPERTRRRVEADRKLIELCERQWTHDNRGFGDGLEMALELAVHEWANHPDYREDWKP